MKKLFYFLLVVVLLMLSACSSKNDNIAVTTQPSETSVSSETTSISVTDSSSVSREEAILRAKEIVQNLSLEEKVTQMLQPATYIVSPAAFSKNCYGSGLIGGDSNYSQSEYRNMIDSYQKNALLSDASIPFMFGTDAVHGFNGCKGAVIFPHNIGIGAANDPELTFKMGVSVAEQLRASHIAFTFSPCVATAQDPRWGRTYESYSSETALTKELSLMFSKGLLEGKVLPCAKHFLGDGNTTYGTGETDMLLDRGNSELSEEELSNILDVYQAQIDAGVLCIMASHSSVNGLKMHENKELIQGTLKDKMDFTGFVISDWESIHNTSGSTLREQTINAVNAGIDMLMEPSSFDECKNYIIEAVSEGTITEDRINDAVTRIIYVKICTGIYNDPYFKSTDSENLENKDEENRDLARQLVEKSLVLIKNNDDLLPLKKNTKVYITGPAANDIGVLCGGWTLSWQGSTDEEKNSKMKPEGKTILDGFEELENEYGITVITDHNMADEADVVLLCLGEKPYAEWYGDSEDISITGEMALKNNENAINEVSKLNKPTVACIVSGRNVILSDYMDNWNSVVMCYLPGSEGNGVANVLMGKVPFTGKLSMPFYEKVEDIEKGKILYNVGYSAAD